MKPTKKQVLFIITGASGVGKSTACNILFENERDYIVIESDLLWNDIYNTPEDDYQNYRKLWMRVCANISQIEKSVVLCGCATPKQFESHEERDLFTEIYYLAIVCNNNILENRMRKGRGITDDNWIKSSMNFNCWLKENADNSEFPIALIDSTELSPKAVAKGVDKWIRERLL